MAKHPTHTGSMDSLSLWEAELRAIVIETLPPERVGAVTSAALGASITTAAAAGAVAAQGGTIMSISTAIGASSAAKVAAGCLAATLAVGGTLAATGKLPDKAQEFSADAAANIGITLPKPGVETGVRGALSAQVGTVVTVANAGNVGVLVEGDGLILTGIEAKGAFTAHVVSQTAGVIICEFRSADEVITVLLSNVAGKVAASATTTQTAVSVGAETSGTAGISGHLGTGKGSVDLGVSGSASVEGSADTGTGAGGTDECGCPSDSGAGAEAEAEAEVSISIRIGG
jgi:hypothetical protein